MTETTVAIVPKRTLQEILLTLNDADQGLAELDLSALQTIVREELPAKVDDYAEVFHRFKASIAYVKDREEEFRNVRKAMEQRFETFKDTLKTTMQDAKFDKLPGRRYRVQLNNNAESTSYLREPDANDLIDFGDFVRIRYEWISEAVKTAIRAGKSLPFAALDRGKSVRFYPQTEKGN